MPYKAPSFGYTYVWVSPEDVPEWQETWDGGRSKGTHGDPTAAQVIGPPERVPIRKLTPPFVITRERIEEFLEGLPSNLEAVFRAVFLEKLGVMGASDKLDVHRSTISRRLDVALDAFGRLIYYRRWAIAKPSCS